MEIRTKVTGEQGGEDLMEDAYKSLPRVPSEHVASKLDEGRALAH